MIRSPAPTCGQDLQSARSFEHEKAGLLDAALAKNCKASCTIKTPHSLLPHRAPGGTLRNQHTEQQSVLASRRVQIALNWLQSAT